MDINFFATYQCNSRCMNCSIWKGEKNNNAGEKLGLEALESLFMSPLVQKTDLIGIAGGEPTIDPFFWKLLKAVPASKKITITTNGLKHEKLMEFLRGQSDRERFLVQVSIDGIKDLNDKIRGVSGGFQKAVDLLAQLKDINVQSDFFYHQSEKLSSDNGCIQIVFKISCRIQYKNGVLRRCI